VSFSGASPVKSKKKGGGAAIVVIVILALLGAGAYFFFKNKPLPKTTDVKVEKPVTPAEVKATSTPAPEGNTKVVKEQKAASEAPAQPKKPMTMAEKAEVKKAEAQKAAGAVATKASAVVSSGPGAADLAKAMEAYKAGDFKTAYDCFKSAGNAGNAEACYQLGLMLSTGKGSVAKNTLQSKVWLKKAAGLGHEAAKAAIQ
jgi:TPR repeat protein